MSEEQRPKPGIGIAEPYFIPAPSRSETPWAADPEADYSGWYCIRTDPWPCPADGCDYVAQYLTAAHLIIVWPEIDDLNLLRQAAAAREVGRNPRPTEYEATMGPACSYYQWEAAGYPVHGVRAQA
jgi:hypothetical protein